MSDEQFDQTVVSEGLAEIGQPGAEAVRDAEAQRAQAWAELQQQEYGQILEAHPTPMDAETADRIMDHAATRAAEMGIPELGEDPRFVRRMYEEAGAHQFLDPVQQIIRSGSGLGRKVLDW